jgi:hypothetical protein
MPTITSGMTLTDGAEATTNYNEVRWSGGGQAPTSPAQETGFFVQGNACNSMRVSRSNTVAGMAYTLSSPIDMSSGNGNEVLGMWIAITSPTAVDTVANNGIFIWVSSSTETGTNEPTAYRGWTVGGSDAPITSFRYVQIDVSNTASFSGGLIDFTNIRRVGVGISTPGTVPTLRSDNIYMDAHYIGRPVYTGTSIALEAAMDWDDFLSDSITNENGLIEDLGGIYRCGCGFQIGDTTQSTATEFIDTSDTKILFKEFIYYNGSTTPIQALDYARDYGVFVEGASASNNTTVTLGTTVGSGDDRVGVLGGSLSTANKTDMTFSVTGTPSHTEVYLYGTTIDGAHEDLFSDFSTDAEKFELISTTVINSSFIYFATWGAAANDGRLILNSTFVDPDSKQTGGANNWALNVNSNGSDPTAGNEPIRNSSFITSGTPADQAMIHFGASITDDTNALNNIKFFGDYSSATLFHAETSHTGSSTFTIQNLNGSNIDANEIENVGGSSNPATVETNFTLEFIDVLGNSEIRVYDNPSPLTGGGTSTEVFGIETVSAATQVGDGTNVFYQDLGQISGDVSFQALGTASFANANIEAGDTFRFIVRDNSENPTLQKSEEFVAGGTVNDGFIQTTTSVTGYSSIFSSAINSSSNTLTITIEKVDATTTATLPSGNYDIVVFRTGSNPIYFLNYSLSANSVIALSQTGDRVYKNPA